MLVEGMIVGPALKGFIVGVRVETHVGLTVGTLVVIEVGVM